MDINDYFSPAFLEEMMRAHAPGSAIQVQSVVPFAVDNSASILVTLTAGLTEKVIGHFGLAVTMELDGVPQTHRMVLKVKPHGRDISGMLAGLAVMCGGPLADVYPPFATLTGFENTHRRELAVYQQFPNDLTPSIWGTYANEAEDVYCVLMEYLDDVTLLNSAMTPGDWTDAHIRTALNQLAEWHARHLTTQPPPPVGSWNDRPTSAFMQQLSPLWEALLTNASRFPDLYTTSRVAELRTAIAQIPAYWAALDSAPKTLIHNDLNPRNTCFKTVNGQLRLCAYDWELATYHVPPYDVVELLAFVLDEDRYALRPAYFEYYRQALHRLTGGYADAAEFQTLTGYAALDFGLHRLGMYMMAHSVSPYPFLPRVVNSYFDTLTQLRPLVGVETHICV